MKERGAVVYIEKEKTGEGMKEKRQTDILRNTYRQEDKLTYRLTQRAEIIHSRKEQRVSLGN